jgi:DNA polymerase III epsilon subunit-like protein
MTATSIIPAALAGHRLVVVDVEGNGQTPPEIIEIALLPVDLGATETGMHSWLIRPQQPITGMVTRKVHGISNDDVADSPSWADVATDVTALLDDRVLVAHNASVEHRVLGAHLPDWAPALVLDTLRLAKYVWPGLPDGYGLDKLIAHAELDPGTFAQDGHHRAGYDTWCTWQLLRRLVEDGKLSWDNLVTTAALPGLMRAEQAERSEGLW